MQDLLERCPVIEFGLVGKLMHKVDEMVSIKDINRLKDIYKNLSKFTLEKIMISSPPSFINIKNGFMASFNFIRKKGKVGDLFEIDIEKFWHSCWIVFFINALVAVLASYGIKTSFDISMKITLLSKLFLITIIDIILYAIIVFYIFKNLNKTELFFKFIIPFNWLQAFQSFVMLFLTYLVLCFHLLFFCSLVLL